MGRSRKPHYYFFTKRILSVGLSAAMWFGTATNFEIPVQAQNQNTQRPTSDLARQNMGLVAAAAGEIKPILLKDIGLMVELKRWVAKDATDHGQIISEADLTNDAIFDRLENDVQFRGVATQLLQQFGYLVPQINPSSALGKQQELLVQERVKWLAQHEEQARAEEAAKTDQELQKARSCDSGVQPDCAQQSSQAPVQRIRQQQEIAPPSQSIPNEINPGILPGQTTSPLERAQLNGGGSGNDFSQLGVSASSLSSLGGSSSTSLLAQLQMGNSDQLGSLGGGGNLQGNLNLQNALAGNSLGGGTRSDRLESVWAESLEWVWCELFCLFRFIYFCLGENPDAQSTILAVAACRDGSRSKSLPGYSLALRYVHASNPTPRIAKAIWYRGFPKSGAGFGIDPDGSSGWP